MPTTIPRPSARRKPARQVTPSIVDPSTAESFSLDQELKPFGTWVDGPIWVPPKDSSKQLAESMLGHSRPFTAKDKLWSLVEHRHREEFTQVREIDLCRASIRLPKGRFYVTVTEQKDFDKITDTIPACVQTRLDEFLAGPGKLHGVKVYYIKPLCVESGSELILTTRDDLMAAITKIQNEVFAEYRRLAPFRRLEQTLRAAANLSLAVPRHVMKFFTERRQKALDAYQARLEFRRRKTALSAARTYCKRRTGPCTFGHMLALTTPLDREDVIEQYCIDQELSRAMRNQLLSMAAGTVVPWFVSFALTASYLSSLSFIAVSPVIVVDPAFVAAMPGSPGVVLKIGHFDEVDGVTHIEI